MASPISVIVPTYNRASFISAAIRSVLAQVRPGDEIIVVDDGSTDSTLEILEQFADRIVLLQGRHGGAGRARNMGLAHARNPLVAFLDSDDEWLPGKLQLQRQLMDARPDILYCFSNFQVERESGAIMHRYLDRWPRESTHWEEVFGPGAPYTSIADLPEGREDFQVFCGDMYRWQLTGLYVLTNTLVARREQAGDALRFAEDLPTYEDLECFFRLSQRGKAAYLDVETAVQRDYAGGRLSDLDKIVRLQCRLTLIERVWGADPAFLASHGALYRQFLDRLRRDLIKLYLVNGQNFKARDELPKLDSRPLSLQLLAHLPPQLTHPTLGLRHAVKQRMSELFHGS